MLENDKKVLARINNEPLLQYALLAAITLFAAALRFYKLGEWSFWIDEIYTIGRAQAHYSSVELTLRNIPPHTNWVPVSLMLISSAMNALGTSEWSVRLVPTIIGVLTIPIIYLPTKNIFGRSVALISALLLAVSPWHIMWSQNGRFYTALLLFSFLALITLYFGIEHNRPTYLIIGLMLFYLALSERIIAGFLFLVIVAYMVIILVFPYTLPQSQGPKRWTILVLALPVIGGILIEAHSLLFNGYSRFFGDFDVFVGQINQSPVRLLASIVWRLGIGTVVLGIVAGLYFSLKKQRAGLFVLIGAALPVVTICVLSLFLFTVDRYVFATLPFWLILCALVIQQLLEKTNGLEKLWPIGLLMLLVTLSMGENWLYYADQNGGRPKWREALAYIDERSTPEDVIYATWPEVGSYYLRDNVRNISNFDPTKPALPDHPVWFVLDESTGWVTPATQNWLDTHAQLNKIFIVRLPSKSMDIRIYFYSP
jgi:mannosyltransferase